MLEVFEYERVFFDKDGITVQCRYSNSCVNTGIHRCPNCSLFFCRNHVHITLPDYVECQDCHQAKITSEQARIRFESIVSRNSARGWANIGSSYLRGKKYAEAVEAF